MDEEKLKEMFAEVLNGNGVRKNGNVQLVRECAIEELKKAYKTPRKPEINKIREELDGKVPLGTINAQGMTILKIGAALMLGKRENNEILAQVRGHATPKLIEYVKENFNPRRHW